MYEFIAGSGGLGAWPHVERPLVRAREFITLALSVEDVLGDPAARVRVALIG
jgi:hypothetical protein